MLKNNTPAFAANAPTDPAGAAERSACSSWLDLCGLRQERQHRQILHGMRRSQSGPGGCGWLDLPGLRQERQHRQVLQRMRRGETTACALRLQQVRLCAGGSDASAKILPGMRGSV